MPNLIIRTIVSPRCLTTGDALRAIYNLHIVESDFILVSGDVISNMKLDAVLREHKCVLASGIVAAVVNLRLLINKERGENMTSRQS